MASASQVPTSDREAELRRRLAEAEETLRAIREGEVDALVVRGAQEDEVFALGDPNPIAEVANGFGCVAAPPHPDDGRHPRVVPAAHVALVDELQEDALGQDGMGEAEASEFVLAGP